MSSCEPDALRPSREERKLCHEELGVVFTGTLAQTPAGNRAPYTPQLCPPLGCDSSSSSHSSGSNYGLKCEPSHSVCVGPALPFPQMFVPAPGEFLAGIWDLFEHPEGVHNGLRLAEAASMFPNPWLVKFCSKLSLFSVSEAAFLTFMVDKPFTTVNTLQTFSIGGKEVMGY